jgi:hypothetical protein
MTWRKVKCWLGLHAPDITEDKGKIIIQRCLYCDRTIKMFERDNENIVRRVR